MTKAETVVGVHTHTHNNFIEIKEGGQAFICDRKMTDYE
mgnify:FL=1